MADDNQDIFGKIDALLEKRVGFGTGDLHKALEDDFPVLTEVVDAPKGTPPSAERRQAERRLFTDRRSAERRHESAEGTASPRPTFTDEQFNRFLDVFEQKLEDLFIRQQLRMEESIRRAFREEADRPRGGHPL